MSKIKVKKPNGAIVEIPLGSTINMGVKGVASSVETIDGKTLRFFIGTKDEYEANHTELIERICGISGSVKTPTTISGLTVEGFKNELRAWLRL